MCGAARRAQARTQILCLRPKRRIVLKIENLYLAQGRMPPVLCSANLPGGDEYNTSAVAAYQGRIKALC